MNDYYFHILVRKVRKFAQRHTDKLQTSEIYFSWGFTQTKGTSAATDDVRCVVGMKVL